MVLYRSKAERLFEIFKPPQPPNHMTRIEEDLQERKHHRKVIQKNCTRLAFAVGIPSVALTVYFLSQKITLDSNTLAVPAFDLGKAANIGMIIAVPVLLVASFPIWSKWISTPSQGRFSKSKDPDEIIPANPVSTELDELMRWIYCITYHAVIGYIGWQFLNYYLYIPFGNGIITWPIKALSIAGLGWSIINTFDRRTIVPNFAAEMYYLGIPVFSNVSPGFTCLGLPKYLASLQLVSFKIMEITIGLMKGDKREQLIIESDLFAAIFDVLFRVQPNDTAKILALEKLTDKKNERVGEKTLVAIVNAALFRIANSNIDDEVGAELSAEDNADGKKDDDEEEEDEDKKIEKAKKAIVNKNTKSKKRFPTIDSLKAATAKIAEELMAETHPQSIRAQMQKVGFHLIELVLKDVENPDKKLLTAAQELAAKELTEKAEYLSTENTLKKIMFIYNGLNMIGQPGELTGDDMIPMAECIRIVEREEGTRTTNEVTSGTNDGGGKKGGGNKKGGGSAPAGTSPTLLVNVGAAGGSGHNHSHVPDNTGDS